jgi:hypothetical protein
VPSGRGQVVVRPGRAGEIHTSAPSGAVTTCRFTPYQ